MFSNALVTIVLASLTSYNVVQGEVIEISFELFAYSADDHVDLEVELLPYSETKAFLSNVPKDVDFLIFQVHSYFHNVILSYDAELLPNNYVNGTNIGLYCNASRSSFFYIKNPNDFNVTCMIAAVPYTNESPVPGGCNMEFHTSIAPYLGVKSTDSVVTVDGAPASIAKKCDLTIIAYDMFYKHLHQRELSVKNYFDSIRCMLTYPSILKNSYVAPKPIEGSKLRRIFSIYSDVGAVYSLIALNKFGNVAVYTPSFFFPPDKNMKTFSATVSIELALLVAISIFLCFGGHRYFVGELFLFGAIFGFLLSFVILYDETSPDADLLLMCNGIGFICGVIWMGLWWRVNSPILSVSLPYMMNGLLISAIFFYLCSIILGDITVFEVDSNYYLALLTFTTIIVLVSTTDPIKYNILACVMYGSYGLILPCDYLFGTHFRYIIINFIRRLTVEGFNLALTKPPLDAADLAVSLVWIILIQLGIKCQQLLSKNRPPFPPLCILRNQMPEATPILSSARFPTYS